MAQILKIRNMKKSIIIIIAAISFTALKAQQIPLYTQYYNNEFLYNPSQTLNEDYSSMSLFYRNQWISSESPLVTQGIVFQTPIKAEKVGLGVNLINDKFGIFNRTGVSMAYSYQVDLNYDHKLLLGLSAGFMNTNYDWNQDVSILADPRFQEAITDRVTTFDATFGLTYKWKELEVGLAIPHLLADDFDFLSESNDLLYFNQRHFVGSASYQFRFSGGDYGLRPLALVRYQPAVNPLLDFSAVFDYKQMAWAAVGYRYEGAMTFGAGVMLHDRFNIGYSYDMNMNSDLTQYFGATHEINLSVRFGSGGFGTGGSSGGKKGCISIEDEDGIETEICLEDLQKEIEDLKKANQQQDETITNHEERISALENKVKKDSLQKVMEEILDEMKVGKGSIDIKGEDLVITGKTRAIVNPEDENGNIWGYKNNGDPIKPFDNYDGAVYKDPNGEEMIENAEDWSEIYDEDGNLITDPENHTGRIKNKEGEYIKDGNGNYIYLNNEGFDDDGNYGNPDGGPRGGDGNNGNINGSRNNGNLSPIKIYEPTELMEDGIRYTAPGNYVVVGSFRNKDYAVAVREQLQEQGYSAGIVYNHFRKWFYVYSHENGDFDQTMQKLMQMQSSGHKDAWVHVIIE